MRSDRRTSHLGDWNKPSLGRSLARLISAIVHPILLPLLTLAALTYLALGGSLRHMDLSALVRSLDLAVVALAVTALPVALLVGVQVVRGRWSDLDVSVRHQRYLLYPVGILCMLLTAVIFSFLAAPLVAIRATLGLAGANSINALTNLKYKVSAHATTASLCATLLWLATPLRDPAILAGPVTAAALLVGWSRVALGRHTTGQVLLGWLVGAAAGGVAVLLAWPLPKLL